MSTNQFKVDFISRIDIRQYYQLHQYRGQKVWSSTEIRTTFYGVPAIKDERRITADGTIGKGYALELYLYEPNKDHSSSLFIIDKPLSREQVRMIETYSLDEQEWFEAFYEATNSAYARTVKKDTLRDKFDKYKDMVNDYVEAITTGKIIVKKEDLEWVQERAKECHHLYPFLFAGETKDQFGVLFHITYNGNTFYGKALIDRVFSELPDGLQGIGIVDFKANGMGKSMATANVYKRQMIVQAAWYTLAAGCCFHERVHPFILMVGEDHTRLYRITRNTIMKTLFGYEEERTFTCRGKEYTEKIKTDGILQRLSGGRSSYIDL